MRKVYTDTGTQLFLDFTVGSTGDESDAINPPAGIFHDDHLFETLRLVDEKAVGDSFDGLIDAPDKGNLADNTLAKGDKPRSQIALRHKAADEDQQDSDDRPQPGHMKTEQGIRLEVDRNDPQEVVHHINDEKEDVDGQSSRDDNGKTGQKNNFYFFLQHIPFLMSFTEESG